MTAVASGSSTFVDASGLPLADTYRFLSGAIVPRPIAWVTSGVAPKTLNLAPFSAFAWVSQHPPMIGITVNLRDGLVKDTVRNMREDGEFVVHIAHEGQLEVLHASSEAREPGESEVELLGLRVADSVKVSVPRLADARIAMECRYDRTIQFSPTGGDFVVGTVVGWHIDDEIREGGRIITERLRPLARVGGPHYGILGEIVPKPAYPG